MSAPTRSGNTTVTLPHDDRSRTGQGTLIEQSRAAAEVYASVLAAKQCPRDVHTAQREMEQVCGMTTLAERAFFRFPRSGAMLTGPSVHLARELARCWGNLHHGVSELRRDDGHGQSEMQAFAWDLESNARAAHIFIVPHKRDKRGGPETLVDMRDIYENNANNGARRVREAIFAVLPFWFVEQAQALCRKTLAEGGGEPLPQRINKAIQLYAELGIRREQLEGKLGQGSSRWTDVDVAALAVTYQSIQRGEVTKEQEFPPSATVTTADLIGEPTETLDTGKRRQTEQPIVDTWFDRHGVAPENRDDYLVTLVDREDATRSNLTAAETRSVLSRFKGYDKTDDPVTALQEDAAAWYRQRRQPRDTEGRSDE